jgi:hypothetical protein
MVDQRPTDDSESTTNLRIGTTRRNVLAGVGTLAALSPGAFAVHGNTEPIFTPGEPERENGLGSSSASRGFGSATIGRSAPRSPSGC